MTKLTYAASESEQMLIELWQEMWTYDDYSEVCVPIVTRNKLGEYLVAKGLIEASEYEPLDPEGNEN